LLAGALTRALTITGAASAVLEMTVDYANTRRQFNRPIGRFQAIQHLVAQAAGEVAICRAAAESAAAAADRLSLPCAAPEIAAAKVIAGEAATTVAQVAHAVHGAIGITDDHVLHHLTRRLWSWREEFGTERHWAARLGRKALAAGAGHWEWLTARDALGR
jgi:acyl-CoA dehydrogenase